MIQISIIIVTWNSQQTLWNCISSLYNHVPSKDFELFVVDNNSTDKAYLDDYADKKNINIIRNTGNLGYAKAVNIGLQHASGDFFLVLNPDMIFLSNPFPRLLREIQGNPQIGVIAPLLQDANGNAQITGYYPTFPSALQYLLTRTLLAEKIAFFRQLADRFFHARIDDNGVHYVDQIPGAFLLFRRDLFGNHPPLNEAYFIWMEDVDFCHRVHEKGLKVATVADEKIIHIGGTSFKMRDYSWKRLVSIQSYLTYMGLYFGFRSYVTNVIIMIVDSLARISFFILFRFWRGRKKIADYVSLEAKILKSVLTHAALHLNSYGKKSGNDRNILPLRED